MPNTKSAKKALKVSARRKKINNVKRNKLSSSTKNLRKAVNSGSKDIKELYSKVQSQLDRAVKSNLITKKSASRKKSRLNSAIKKKSK